LEKKDPRALKREAALHRIRGQKRGVRIIKKEKKKKEVAPFGFLLTPSQGVAK